jgi:hypothetical protein
MNKQKIHDDRITLYLAGLFLFAHEAGKQKNQQAVIDIFGRGAKLLDENKDYVNRLAHRLEQAGIISRAPNLEVEPHQEPPPSLL